MKTKGKIIYRTKKVFSIAVFLVLTGLTNVHAAPVDSLMAKANQYYANLEFDQAAMVYQSVVDEGYASTELFYNLGNAYYKQDRLAEAILYYEKALELSPYDKDIKDNLKMANMLIVDKVERIPEFFLKRGWQLLVDLFTPNVWAIMSLLFFAAALFFFFLYVLASQSYGRRIRWIPAGSVLFLVALLAYVFSLSRKHDVINDQDAIIMDLSVSVKSSPDELGTNVFMLHEGTKVEVQDSLENWREIKIANGNKGWVKKTSISTI